MSRNRIALVGPVYPFRAGIAHCTTRLAEELSRRFDLTIVSFKRQYPRRFYPGGDSIDPTLRNRVPAGAEFSLDLLNPLTWIRAGRTLRGFDAVVFVWWIWVWAIPYLVLFRLSGAPVILQCHNVSDKEPSWWKSALSNAVFRRAHTMVVHATSEQVEARLRVGQNVPIVRTFLPVHEMGGAIPTRQEARSRLGIPAERVALFFGHVRPFKGLDIALRAWKDLSLEVLLIVAGEIWWNETERYQRLVKDLGLERTVRFDTRYIADAEIADYFAASDVVVAPYRQEAQSGVVMTAFHFGRPVIATAVGGIPEVVENGVNGLLVEAENPAALARAVDNFFTAFDRSEMEAAATRTAGRYSWQEYAEGVAALIERMISSSQQSAVSSQ